MPLRPVKLKSPPLGLDSNTGYYYEYDAKHLETGREGAVVRPAAVEEEEPGECERGAHCRTLDCTAHGRLGVRLELFFCEDFHREV